MAMIGRPGTKRDPLWSAPVLLKYALLQLPDLAILIIGIHYLREWIQLSSWAIGVICLLWIAKDVILYPFVWRAYDWRSQCGDGLIGERGVARCDLSPIGYVHVRGELWRAQLKDDRSIVQTGQPVKISAREGLTLTVEPLEGPRPEEYNTLT
jgi:membrane protein implicated in regulation of membrane protease activity